MVDWGATVDSSREIDWVWMAAMVNDWAWNALRHRREDLSP